MPAPAVSRLLAAAVSLVAMLAVPTGAAALPSDLVSAFGDDGLVSFDPRPGTTAGSFDPQAVHVLADGRTLLAGQDTNADIIVARLLPGGGLDPSFGTAGLTTIPIGVDTYDEVGGLDVDTSGRILIGGRMEGDAFVLRLTADGQRDPSFDGDGLLTVTDPGGFGQFSDIAADGTGFYVIRSGYPARVYRYTAAGVVDEAFGLGGVSTGPTDMNDTKLALDALRRIVVAGSITGSGYRVYRLQGMSDTAPGFYDATFAAVPIDLTGVTYTGAFRDLAIDGTDNVHLVGNPSTEGYELIRISAAGSVGLPVASAAGPGGSDSPGAIAILGGSVVVAGQTETGGFVELRSTTTGALVGSFNGGAAYTFACGSGSFCPVGALTTSGAQITVVTEEPDDTARVARISASGAPDTTFSGDGFDSVEQRVPWGNDVVDSVATADGSLYILGSAGVYNDESTYIAKRLADGRPDPAFGTGGVLVTDLRPASPEYVSSIAVDGSGRIFVFGGYASADVWRFTSAGVDGSFGTAGKVSITFPGANQISGSTMTLDGSRLVVGGYDYVNPSEYRIWIHRIAADSGAPDPSFNGGTARVLDLDGGGTDSEYLNAIAPGPGGTILAAATSDNRVRIVRLTDAGAPDGAFGTGGVSALGGLGSVDPGAPVLLAPTADGRTIIATAIVDTIGSKVLVARITGGGDLDTGYGAGGSRTLLAGDSTADTPFSLVLDGAGRAVLGGGTGSGSARDALLARLTADGAADDAFAPGGFVRRDLSRRGAVDGISRLHVRGNELFAVGVRRAGGDVRETFVAAFGEPRPPAAATPGPAPESRPARKVSSRITRPRGKQPLPRSRLRTIRGTASATGGTLRRVQVSIRRIEPRRCAWVTSRRGTIKRSRQVKGRCTKPVWITASGTTTWSLKLARALPAGRYEIRSRARLADGTTESSTARSGPNVLIVRLR